MSIRSEQVLVCDFCKKECSDKGQTYYGGHPFNGWIVLKFRGGSSALSELQKKRDFDFCSRACLMNHLTKSDLV